MLDAVGGEVGLGALSAMRDGGVLVTVSASAVAGLREAAAGRVRVEGILVEPDRLGMEALALSACVPMSKRRSHSRRPAPRTPSASRAERVGRSFSVSD